MLQSNVCEAKGTGTVADSNYFMIVVVAAGSVSTKDIVTVRGLSSVHLVAK